MIKARASIVLLSLAVLAGCGGSNDAGKTITVTTASAATATTSTSATHPASPVPMSIVVYRVRNGTLRPERVHVPSTTGVATAALDALDLGATVTVSGGTARVDRPQSTPGEIAEIVYTLTGFPTILRVDIAGRTSVTRDKVAARYVAPILVDLPVAGDRFDGAVTGTASVFEANLVVELVQDGKVLSKRTVTASEGAPARGTFATQLDTSSATPGAAATVVAFSPSAADGSEQHRVEVPVTLR